MPRGVSRRLKPASDRRIYSCRSSSGPRYSTANGKRGPFSTASRTAATFSRRRPRASASGTNDGLQARPDTPIVEATGYPGVDSTQPHRCTLRPTFTESPAHRGRERRGPQGADRLRQGCRGRWQLFHVSAIKPLPGRSDIDRFYPLNASRTNPHCQRRIN